MSPYRLIASSSFERYGSHLAFPDSTSFVIITIAGDRSVQTMSQKSLIVFARGPWVAMYALGSPFWAWTRTLLRKHYSKILIAAYSNVVSVYVSTCRIARIGSRKLNPTVWIWKHVAVAILDGTTGYQIDEFGGVGRYRPKLGVQSFDILQAGAKLPPIHAIAGRQKELGRRTVKNEKGLEWYHVQVSE